jgi:hypothetical protein
VEGKILRKLLGAVLVMSVLSLGCAGARGQEAAGDLDDLDAPDAVSGAAQPREHVRHMRAHKKPAPVAEAAGQGKAATKSGKTDAADKQSRAKASAGPRESRKRRAR